MHRDDERESTPRGTRWLVQGIAKDFEIERNFLTPSGTPQDEDAESCDRLERPCHTRIVHCWEQRCMCHGSGDFNGRENRGRLLAVPRGLGGFGRQNS